MGFLKGVEKIHKNKGKNPIKIPEKLGMKYEDNVDKVEKVIINDIIPAIQAMESVNEGTCEYMGISELADSCVKYQIKFIFIFMIILKVANKIFVSKKLN